MLLCRTFGIFLAVFPLVIGVPGVAHAAQAPGAPRPSSHTLVLDGLGKGAAPLDGPWQFQLGDDPAWAEPAYDDSHWEQITAEKPWGMQGHANYNGFAWYRRTVSITPAPGISPEMALLIPGVLDVYQVYWNGVEVGHRGQMPPPLRIITGGPAQIYHLGPVHSGVVAIRVWSMPPPSNASAAAGGFVAVPQIGSSQAIEGLNTGLNYQWLRRQQFTFALTSLYTLVALLSLVAWLRDRKQWLFFWMTVFAFTPLAELLLRGLHIPYSAGPLNFAAQTEIQIREISQWFLLLWLLQLHDQAKLVRFTRIAALIALCGGFCDGMLFLFYPSVLSDRGFQITDAVFTLPLLVAEIVPLILVFFAVLRRQRLDSSRWFVAAFAFLSAMIYAVTNIAIQGSRFTHLTLAANLSAPQFSLGGSPIGLLTIIRTLLFLSIVYAVIHYSIAERRRQAGMEQEIQNARELQQVLVPETVPSLKGFTLTSAYRPAQEVGGDFFQIIPLAGGSTLVVLGDVSGKGLKAAMAVSLIVGAISSSAESTGSPAEILAALNRRLHGRLNGGFATCLALRLDAQGDCMIACAGHPAPFLNGSELPLPGALPLGITPNASYNELAISLQAGDHLSLYTDGLLEARSASGEIYGFDRLKNLFSTQPDAAQATEAAVAFGQDDDITVLTLTRLKVGEESSTLFIAPVFEPVG
jgi:hypothetical protein